MLLQAAKFIGAGLATIGLAGAGVGIGSHWRLSLRVALKEKSMVNYLCVL